MSYFRSIVQNVVSDSNNSSSTNLTSENGYKFVGAPSSTLGVAGLQWSLKTDQNATVYIEQSPGQTTGVGTVTTNGTTTLTGSSTKFLRDFVAGDLIYVFGETVRTVATVEADDSLTVTSAFSTSSGSLSYIYYPWDISDTFDYYYSKGGVGSTIQAINSYWRIRVLLSGTSDTTYFRLQGVLCPIVESLPRSTDDGNLKVCIEGMKDEYGFEVENTPIGEIRVAQTTRLSGSNFEGSTIDPNFWTASIANDATITQGDCKVVLDTKTTSANGAATFYSVRRARYVSGVGICYRSIISISVGATNNKRRWGVAYGSSLPSITDGAYFQIDGTTFSVVTLKNNTPTVVSSGSFNGDYGAIWSPGTLANTFEIYWTNSKVYFTVGGKVLHLVSASLDTWSATMSFNIFFDNVNSNSAQTSNTLTCRVASIKRLGTLLTQPTYRYQSGTTAGIVCKYGPGNLHSLVVSAVPTSGSVVTIYDGTSTGGSVIAAFTFTYPGGGNFNPMSFDFKGLPFFNGLFLAIATQSANVTLIYE